MQQVIILLLLLHKPSEDQLSNLIHQRAAELKRNPVTQHVARRIARATISAAQKHDLPVPVILAVMETESAYGTRELSAARCHGLMQINPARASAFARLAGLKRWSVDRIEDNIDMGAAYLRSLLNRYGRLSWAASAYNRGEGLFERQGRPVGRYALAVLRKIPMLWLRLKVLAPQTLEARVY